MLKVNTPGLTRRLASLGLLAGLAAYAPAGAQDYSTAPQPPTTICLTNACMPRQDAATAEARSLARAMREQAYAALADRGGLTPDEGARLVANLSRLADAYDAKMARGPSAGPLGLSLAEVQAILGSAYGDHAALARVLIDQGQVVPFTRPVLGVGYSVTPEGVAVSSVTPGGPAALAGLMGGDVIALTSGKVITVTPGGYVP